MNRQEARGELLAVRLNAVSSNLCEALDMAIEALSELDIVRCKDCKWCSHFTDGHIECRLLYDLRPVPCTYVTMHEDDFCSYGERKEE